MIKTLLFLMGLGLGMRLGYSFRKIRERECPRKTYTRPPARTAEHGRSQYRRPGEK